MSCAVLGYLATVIRTKENAIQTNQISTLLLNEWPRTIGTATKISEIFLINCFVLAITLA